MSKRLIEVGLSIIHGLGREELFPTAAEELIKNALRTINIKDLQMRCALLLATADWCQFSSSISEAIRSGLKRTLGYEVPLIGSSMAGLYCSTDPNPVVKHGLLLVALSSNNLWLTVSHLENPYAGTQEVRKRRLNEMAKDLERQAGVNLGASADRFLFGFLPGVVSDQNGNSAYYDNELHPEVLGAFFHRYPLFGASSANAVEPTDGYQFANDRCLKSSLAIAIVESDLATAAMMGHGFTRSGSTRVSVDGLAGNAESSYDVTHLDGRPAGVRMRELSNEGKARLGRPIFGLPCGDDFHIIWPHEIDEPAGDSIRLKRKVARGDQLYNMDASPEQMLMSAEHTLQRVLSRTGAQVEDLGVILGFSCAGRLKYYTSQNLGWMDAINRLRESYLGIPLVWALSAGEFGLDQWRHTRSNNMSISITCVMNTYSRRARTRLLQGKLLKAASHLAITDSPMKSMEAALVGALSAGATGGQVCFVDPQTHRIIGREYGVAVQHPQSTQDWSAVADLTDREAPQQIGGQFPSYMRDWSMAVVPDTPLQLDFNNGPPDLAKGNHEDLLTLIVRTQQAVFIPDSRDPRFHCDQKAINAGNIGCQLAFPLMGSRGKAIATIQLGFPDGTHLDRENFALWVGYAQKAAAALERTQEAEERGIMEKISLLGEEIMQTSVDVQVHPYAWCREFLNLVVRLLGADGAHFRVLSENGGSYEYNLTCAVGHMADLLPFTRQTIKEGDGSYNIKVLKKGGWISNTREETDDFNKNVRPIENAHKYREALTRKLGQLESQAILPLYDQKQVLGSFVIYSTRRYLFTERRVRIARVAAAIAGAIFRAKRIDHERARLDMETSRLDVERTWILDSLMSVAGSTAEDRLRSLIKHICTEIQADVASLYVWHETAKKLILHTSYNWYERMMEGKAAYEFGEGWTGSLALSGEDQVILINSNSANASRCKKKYYNQMVPPEHQVEEDQFDTRIGIRLSAGGRFVGVVTFLYYSENSSSLPAKTDNIINYLQMITRLITLGVEAAKQEAAQNRTQELFDVKNNVASQLIQTPDHQRGWEVILDQVREGFNVERVTFYYVRPDRRIEISWFAQSRNCAAPVKPIKPSEPYGALGDLVYHRKTDVFIYNPDDARINQWPNNTDLKGGTGIKSLYAVSVVTTKGDICGVLEFVNRVETTDHPFAYFDNSERSAALDVARYLAAAIEEREHEKAFNELTSQLATATKIGASGLFGAIVMHQVMTPFANIRGSIDWLLRHTDSAIEDRNKHLKRIEASCSQAVQIIEEAAHRGTPDHRHASLRTIIRQALRVMEPELPMPGVKLKFKDDDGNQKIFVNVDLWSVVGALVNLLSNALDAMKGSGDLTIWTQVNDGGKQAMICIHNTGPSLTEHEITQLFQLGFSTKPLSEGHLGFGLPLAKQAIEAAGGTIKMSSPDRGGVEVNITLPVANAQKVEQTS